jgi:shikimate dehydrogenase
MGDDELVRAAVLGSPISHSLSPVLHRAGYAAVGLKHWSYEAIELDETAFTAWFPGLGPQWRGLSLTMPLKQVALEVVDDVTPLARAVGAANTVTWDRAGRSLADNTDVHGIVEALRSAGVKEAETASVLGVGATACSAVAALAQLGCQEVRLLARSPARAGQVLAVAARLGLTASVLKLDRFDAALKAEVLISTLPGPAATGWFESLRGSGLCLPAGVLLDVSYQPWPTTAAAIWTSAGAVVVGGFEMLLHQAAAQFTLMTGREAPIEAMRAAGEAALRC